MNDVDKITEKLARVGRDHPGAPESGPGARALLAAITADERESPAPRRRIPAARLGVGLAAAAALAVGIVVGPSLLDDRPGVSSSYAVTRSPEGIVIIEVRDFADAPGLARRLAELGVPAVVDLVPEGSRCREPRGVTVDDIPKGLYSLPENITGDPHGPGWQMRIDTRLFRPGETFVWTISPHAHGGSSTSTILMKDPVAPCVLEADPNPGSRMVRGPALADRQGGPLEGFRSDEKSVGEVRAELARRKLKATYLIVDVPEGNPGGYAESPDQTRTVGDDWTVWEAFDTEPGTVQLLVTERRHDRNPVYGGPRDALLPE
ncbi:hypothetical protein [Nonomuraea soli]|uniref:Uncharacterized protein n=1 Tax=Nonomuraea soli TaxID=1032476 RepID=A0A7W0CS61_9ACTN|nr:hypothetical protein [Nonomuraea soli]MBA2896344.1 hypothetical protein [Nonomuraea soli]